MKHVPGLSNPFHPPAQTGSAGVTGAARRETDTRPLPSTFLTLKVQEAFSADAALKYARIVVETFSGVVQLSGVVNKRYEQDRAIQIASAVDGVHSIRNCMQLASSSGKSRQGR